MSLEEFNRKHEEWKKRELAATRSEAKNRILTQQKADARGIRAVFLLCVLLIVLWLAIGLTPPRLASWMDGKPGDFDFAKGGVIGDGFGAVNALFGSASLVL